MINNDYIGTVLPNLYIDSIKITDDEFFNIFEIKYSFIEFLSDEIFSWSDMPKEALENIKISFRLFDNENQDFVNDFKVLKPNFNNILKYSLKDFYDISIYEAFYTGRKESKQRIEDSVFDLVLNTKIDERDNLNQKQAAAMRELLEAASGNSIVQYSSSLITKRQSVNSVNQDEKYLNKILLPKSVELKNLDLLITIYYDFNDPNMPDIMGTPVHIKLFKEKDTQEQPIHFINSFKFNNEKYIGPVIFNYTAEIDTTTVTQQSTGNSFQQLPPRTSIVPYKEDEYYLSKTNNDKVRLEEVFLKFDRVFDERINRLPLVLNLLQPPDPPKYGNYFSKIFYTRRIESISPRYLNLISIEDEKTIEEALLVNDFLDTKEEILEKTKEATALPPTIYNSNNYINLIDRYIYFFDYIRFIKENSSFPYFYEDRFFTENENLEDEFLNDTYAEIENRGTSVERILNNPRRNIINLFVKISKDKENKYQFMKVEFDIPIDDMKIVLSTNVNYIFNFKDYSRETMQRLYLSIKKALDVRSSIDELINKLEKILFYLGTDYADPYEYNGLQLSDNSNSYVGIKTQIYTHISVLIKETLTGLKNLGYKTSEKISNDSPYSIEEILNIWKESFLPNNFSILPNKSVLTQIENLAKFVLDKIELKMPFLRSMNTAKTDNVDYNNSSKDENLKITYTIKGKTIFENKKEHTIIAFNRWIKDFNNKTAIKNVFEQKAESVYLAKGVDVNEIPYILKSERTMFNKRAQDMSDKERSQIVNFAIPFFKALAKYHRKKYNFIYKDNEYYDLSPYTSSLQYYTTIPIVSEIMFNFTTLAVAMELSSVYELINNFFDSLTAKTFYYVGFNFNSELGIYNLKELRETKNNIGNSILKLKFSDFELKNNTILSLRQSENYKKITNFSFIDEVL